MYILVCVVEVNVGHLNLRALSFTFVSVAKSAFVTDIRGKLSIAERRKQAELPLF